MQPILDDAIRGALREGFAEAADALFPPACPLCGGEGQDDLLGCAEHRLELLLDGPRCGRCAAGIPAALPDGDRCAACRVDPPPFARAVALGDYRSSIVLREWILALKHGGRKDLALPLGRLLGARLADARPPGAPPAVLVPVPLHWLRRLERGFDQALLLARAAAEVEGSPVVRAIGRARATAAQGAPGSLSRTANVRGAFRPRRIPRRRARAIAGREVWIVDDVLTSGATAAECARVLKRMGARTVGVLALARA